MAPSAHKPARTRWPATAAKLSTSLLLGAGVGYISARSIVERDTSLGLATAGIIGAIFMLRLGDVLQKRATDIEVAAADSA